MQVVDGLGRPLSDVEVMLYQGDDIYRENVSTGVRYTFVMGKDGNYHGDVPISKTVGESLQWIVSRKGKIILLLSFRAHNGLSQQGELVIKQKVPIEEVQNLTSLEGDELKSRILEILTSDEIGRSDFEAELFKINDHITLALRSALDHPRAFIYAMSVLCIIADPSDLKTIASRVLSASERLDSGLNIYSILAGALVSPSSPEEWEFLRKSLVGRGRERTAEGYALMALAANGGGRALAILKEAHIESDEQLRFIKFVRGGLKSYPDLKMSIKEASALFVEEKEEKYFRIRRITLDRPEQKAFVDCDVYYGPLAGRGYDLVFHKSKGLWVLKGIWLSRIY